MPGETVKSALVAEGVEPSSVQYRVPEAAVLAMRQKYLYELAAAQTTVALVVTLVIAVPVPLVQGYIGP